MQLNPNTPLHPSHKPIVLNNSLWSWNIDIHDLRFLIDLRTIYCGSLLTNYKTHYYYSPNEQLIYLINNPLTLLGTIFVLFIFLFVSELTGPIKCVLGSINLVNVETDLNLAHNPITYWTQLDEFFDTWKISNLETLLFDATHNF